MYFTGGFLLVAGVAMFSESGKTWPDFAFSSLLVLIGSAALLIAYFGG